MKRVADEERAGNRPARRADLQLFELDCAREELVADIARALSQAAMGDTCPGPLAPGTLAFLEDLSQTLEPACLELVLDSFARVDDPYNLFRGYAPSTALQLIGEKTILASADERVAQISQLLFNHRAAGPGFFM
jgi:hypothetical protein